MLLAGHQSAGPRRTRWCPLSRECFRGRSARSAPAIGTSETSPLPSPAPSGRRRESNRAGLALVRWDPPTQGVMFERVSSDAGADRLFAEHNGAGLVAFNGAGSLAAAWRQERRRGKSSSRRSLPPARLPRSCKQRRPFSAAPSTALKPSGANERRDRSHATPMRARCRGVACPTLPPSASSRRST